MADSPLDALTTKTKRDLLTLFFSYPNDSFYLTELFNLMGGGRSRIQNALTDLTEGGIISKERKGRSTYYQANRGCPLFNDFIMIISKELTAKKGNHPELLKKSD